MMNKMKKVYEAPVLTVDTIKTEDIITTSVTLSGFAIEKLIGMGKVNIDIDFE